MLFKLRSKLTGEKTQIEAPTIYDACKKLGWEVNHAFVMNMGELVKQKKAKLDDKCECGRDKPEMKPEIREGGNTEMVGYCPCGVTYA